MIFFLKDFNPEMLPIGLKKYIKKDIFDCEIGFGDGIGIVSEGKMRPEIGFIGIEYSFTSIKKAEKRVKNEGLKNILFMKCEALAAFDIIFQERQFHKTIIRFPDPWPKKRHIKYRLLNREFLTIAANRTEDEGEMYIATDDIGYRDFIISELKEIPYWKSIYKGGYRLKTEGLLTSYEKKWRSIGKDIFEIRLEKVSHPPQKRHILLSSYLKLPLIKTPECISNRTIKKGNAILKTGKINYRDKKMEIDIYLIDWHLFQKAKITLSKDGNRFVPAYQKDFLPAKSFELLFRLFKECQ